MALSYKLAYILLGLSLLFSHETLLQATISLKSKGAEIQMTSGQLSLPSLSCVQGLHHETFTCDRNSVSAITKNDYEQITLSAIPLKSPMSQQLWLPSNELPYRACDIDAFSTTDEKCLLRTFSNAIVYNATRLASQGLSIQQNTASIYDLTDAINTNSSALVYNNRITSNALLYGIAHASQSVDIDWTTDVLLSSDLWLSSDSTVSFSTSIVVDGNGHTINFARNNYFMSIPEDVRIEFRNITLSNFSDCAFCLAEGAQICLGDNTRVEILRDTELYADFEITGNVVLNGFGNTVRLGSSQFHVTGTNWLTLQNIVLQEVTSSNIVLDYTGVLDLRDVTLTLTQDYSFTSGRCVFENQVKFSGGHEFAYTSTGVSMIAPYAQVQFTPSSSFNYNPRIANRDLFAMKDTTSVLSFSNATVATSTVGMRLTRGTVMLDNYNKFYNDSATSANQGFSFGNNNADDDVTIMLLPGANVELMSGFLTYNNVTS